jgi:hypothetical protein
MSDQIEFAGLSHTTFQMMANAEHRDSAKQPDAGLSP